MNDLILAVLMFAGVLVLLVFARAKTSRFEIKSPDIVLALIPIVLWMFLTGKISELGVGDLTIKSAILSASAAPVSPLISAAEPLPIEAIEPFAKGGVQQIPRLIDRQAQALSFQIGHGGYWGPAIEEYLQDLTEHPFLKHVIVLNDDGTLFGMADASELAQHLGEDIDAQEFADWLNFRNTAELARLPGFISAMDAVGSETPRDEVLEKMERLEADTLPVLNEEGRFIGVVDRGRVTAAMLVEIARLLK